jgi:hypothetical protein
MANGRDRGCLETAPSGITVGVRPGGEASVDGHGASNVARGASRQVGAEKETGGERWVRGRGSLSHRSAVMGRRFRNSIQDKSAF